MAVTTVVILMMQELRVAKAVRVEAKPRRQ